MRLIIAGGRDYCLTAEDYAKLDAIEGVTEVVSGKGGLADEGGELWADSRGIPVQPFPALWDKLDEPGAITRRRSDGTLYNAAAGPQRNRRMALYAAEDHGACALFQGGRGTESMYREAKAAGLRVFDFRQKSVPAK